jgi:[ribosomal protein S5]-alanine N-acetyltransferase
MADDAMVLRPLEEADLGRLRRLDTDPTVSEPFEWYGFPDPHARRRRWEEDGYMGRDPRLMAIGLPDRTLAGVVSWREVRPGGGADGGCYELGILLFPEHRGRGLGSAAQRLLVEYVFATTLANRVQAITDTRNVAEQRVLERIGFRREGVLRGVAFIAGAWRDMVVYGLLRDELMAMGAGEADRAETEEPREAAETGA